MNLADRTDRELLEQLVKKVDRIQADVTDVKEGQEAILQKVDFIAKRTDERFDEVDRRFDEVDRRFEKGDRRFDSVVRVMNERFDKNQAEHAEMQRTLSEHTGNQAELGTKYQVLDDERKAMFEQQKRLARALKQR